MQVKLTTDITGMRNGVPWPPIGEIVDLPTEEAESLLANAQAVKGDQPHAYADNKRAFRLTHSNLTDKKADKLIDARLKVAEANAEVDRINSEIAEGRGAGVDDPKPMGWVEPRLPKPEVIEMTASPAVAKAPKAARGTKTRAKVAKSPVVKASVAAAADRA